jgi:HAD superfamily hydrolase (TIGR01458 family)
VLSGKRVLALTMAAIRPELEGVELVGEEADAVLIGGADETDEPNRVFSYMNLARAFAELDSGAELYCLHKNRWWQTSRGPLLDSGAFVAGLEYAAGVEATVLGKPSPAFFGVALDAIDADAELTWMVGDDLEADVIGAKSCGLKAILVRTGKFRESALDDALVKPDAIVDSLGDVPDYLARTL